MQLLEEMGRCKRIDHRRYCNSWRGRQDSCRFSTDWNQQTESWWIKFDRRICTCWKISKRRSIYGFKCNFRKRSGNCNCHRYGHINRKNSWSDSGRKGRNSSSKENGQTWKNTFRNSYYCLCIYIHFWIIQRNSYCWNIFNSSFTCSSCYTWRFACSFNINISFGNATTDQIQCNCPQTAFSRNFRFMYCYLQWQNRNINWK